MVTTNAVDAPSFLPPLDGDGRGGMTTSKGTSLVHQPPSPALPAEGREYQGCIGQASHHVFPLDPANYQRHKIHAQERNWAETNCYVDVWVELLHAWGFEPIAALPFTLAIDFEGDQWTFFKFPHADLFELYSLEVLELATWRPLATQIDEQLRMGRPVLVELDSFYLPDTAGTAYRLAHVKSTVAAIDIDIANQRLGYFHGQGYYHLKGEDFVNVLHVNGIPHASVLPPYVEFVKRRSTTKLAGDALTEASLKLLRRHLNQLPEANPFTKFIPRIQSDLDWLMCEPIEMFHQYSFATLRQFGACYELSATYLKWLQSRGVTELDRPIAAYTELAAGAKTIQFQLARSMARKKPLDLTSLNQMAITWETAADDMLSRFS